jgi:hypothetical protein
MIIAEQVGTLRDTALRTEMCTLSPETYYYSAWKSTLAVRIWLVVFDIYKTQSSSFLQLK